MSSLLLLDVYNPTKHFNNISDQASSIDKQTRMTPSDVRA